MSFDRGVAHANARTRVNNGARNHKNGVRDN